MIYFIGDLHLDHTNIISYCNRPFTAIEEMNEVLVQRWNDTVKDTDTVYYLGDISHGKGARLNNWWWKQLNGNKVLIRGNHDRDVSGIFPVYHSLIKTFNGTEFMMIHSPSGVEWQGWIIHGHAHNNDPELHPLINKDTKAINVSVEMLDYYPLSLDKLINILV